MKKFAYPYNTNGGNDSDSNKSLQSISTINDSIKMTDLPKITELTLLLVPLRQRVSLNVIGDATVGEVKKRLLKTFGPRLYDEINMGIFMPGEAGRKSKFLEDERLMSEYIGDRTKVKLKELVKSMIRFVQRNDCKSVERLLAKGFDPNFQCHKTGETPLTLAVTKSKPELLITVLINGGALWDFYSKSGFTPLHKAAEVGNFEAVKKLLDFGQSPNCVDSFGLTPVYHSILNDADTRVCHLLLYEHSDLGQTDGEGLQEIHQAARHNRVEHIDLLLMYGMDVNSRCSPPRKAIHDLQINLQRRTTPGDTPLHVAASAGQRSAVLRLLYWGADPSLVNVDGKTPIDSAQSKGYPELAESIRMYKGNRLVGTSFLPAPTYNQNRRARKAPVKSFITEPMLVSGRDTDTDGEQDEDDGYARHNDDRHLPPVRRQGDLPRAISMGSLVRATLAERLNGRVNGSSSTMADPFNGSGENSTASSNSTGKHLKKLKAAMSAAGRFVGSNHPLVPIQSTSISMGQKFDRSSSGSHQRPSKGRLQSWLSSDHLHLSSEITPSLTAFTRDNDGSQVHDDNNFGHGSLNWHEFGSIASMATVAPRSQGLSTAGPKPSIVGNGPSCLSKWDASSNIANLIDPSPSVAFNHPRPPAPPPVPPHTTSILTRLNGAPITAGNSTNNSPSISPRLHADNTTNTVVNGVNGKLNRSVTFDGGQHRLSRVRDSFRQQQPSPVDNDRVNAPSRPTTYLDRFERTVKLVKTILDNRSSGQSQPHLTAKPSFGLTIRTVKDASKIAQFLPSNDRPSLQTVKCIVPNSSADKQGVCEGDYLVKINGIDVSRSCHDDVVHLLSSGTTNSVQLTLISLNRTRNSHNCPSHNLSPPIVRPRPFDIDSTGTGTTTTSTTSGMSSARSSDRTTCSSSLDESNCSSSGLGSSVSLGTNNHTQSQQQQQQRGQANSMNRCGQHPSFDSTAARTQYTQPLSNGTALPRSRTSMGFNDATTPTVYPGERAFYFPKNPAFQRNGSRDSGSSSISSGSHNNQHQQYTASSISSTSNGSSVPNNVTATSTVRPSRHPQRPASRQNRGRVVLLEAKDNRRLLRTAIQQPHRQQSLNNTHHQRARSGTRALDSSGQISRGQLQSRVDSSELDILLPPPEQFRC